MEKQLFSFDDIALVPQYSELRSRSDAITSCTFLGLELEVPFISANMDTVTGPSLAIAMHKAGGIGALHRFNSIDDAVSDYKKVVSKDADCLVSVGVDGDVENRVVELYKAGARRYIVDIAHGHCVMMKETLKWLKSSYKDVYVIAGNIATREAVKDLYLWGVDCLKCGIGPGSVCKTRLVTGHGIPQFSAIEQCASVASELGISIIADGGIRTSGDIVKSFVGGADMVMLGSLLAGTTESEADIVYGQDGLPFKRYSGMASLNKTLERKINHTFVPASEGVDANVPVVGSVDNVVQRLKKGLQSGMSYCGAKTLSEINQKAKWEIQTSSGYREGTPFILDR